MANTAFNHETVEMFITLLGLANIAVNAMRLAPPPNRWHVSNKRDAEPLHAEAVTAMQYMQDNGLSYPGNGYI